MYSTKSASLARAVGHSSATCRMSASSSARKDVLSGVGIPSMGRKSCRMMQSILHEADCDTLRSLTHGEGGWLAMRMTWQGQCKYQ
jgi:hypothetical protein